MNQEDMFIDIDSFDFNSIDSDIEVVPTKAPKPSTVVEETDDSDDDFEYDYDEDEVEGGEEVEAEDEDDMSADTMQSFAENFADLPDELEFNFGDEKITKGEFVQAAKQRREINMVHEEMSGYIKSLSDNETRIQGYLAASMSETEARLMAVNEKLANPDELAPSDLKKYYTAKRDLEARHRELENNMAKVREEEIARKEQINVIKIRQTDIALRGTPGYAGMDTIRELALFAEQSGLSSEMMLEGMSPELIKLLMDAKKFRSGKAARDAKLSAASKGKAPQSVASKPKPSKHSGKALSAKKAMALKALNSGNIPTDFYDVIED